MRDDRTVRDTSVQSVCRAISVLQVLTLCGASGVTGIATEFGVHKSTVFRLLATLESRGLVEQHSKRGRYRLGYVSQLAQDQADPLDPEPRALGVDVGHEHVSRRSNSA
jgi:predicted transcriptional regulator